MIHFADHHPQFITEEQLINYARENAKNYGYKFNGTPEQAIQILNDIGNVTITPIY